MYPVFQGKKFEERTASVEEFFNNEDCVRVKGKKLHIFILEARGAF